MPPKLRLHKSTGKSKVFPSSSSSSNNEGSLLPEVAEQFELELCWCIQQLQSALASGKLNPKQLQDHTKAMNTLMSNSAPIVKKRLVMRLSFGDYRAKMAAQEKKSSLANSKLKATKATPSKKTVFVNKSNSTPSSNNFKFNFESPADSVAAEVSKLELKSGCENNKFEYKSSENNFKFNFSVDD